MSRRAWIIVLLLAVLSVAAFVAALRIQPSEPRANDARQEGFR